MPERLTYKQNTGGCSMIFLRFPFASKRIFLKSYKDNDVLTASFRLRGVWICEKPLNYFPKVSPVNRSTELGHLIFLPTTN